MESLRLMRLRWLERTLGLLNEIARKRGRDLGPAHLTVGIEGENAVFFYLLRKQYTVVARRWSSGDVSGDVDLIAWDGPMLCFIEVKTRTARDMTPAETAVDEHKRNVLRRLAHRYVRQLPGSAMPPVRFDVVSVYAVPGQEREFVHFEGAFAWQQGWRD
jgi:putative endonuclease